MLPFYLDANGNWACVFFKLFTFGHENYKVISNICHVANSVTDM